MCRKQLRILLTMKHSKNGCFIPTKQIIGYSWLHTAIQPLISMLTLKLAFLRIASSRSDAKEKLHANQENGRSAW